MELACFNEQNYQLELQTYQTTFPNFKYKPPSFIFVETGTRNITPITPIGVQLVVTKLVSPLKSGTSLDIIPLPILDFYHTY
jgi:hypothetical protein